jgi:MFS family permease
VPLVPPAFESWRVALLIIALPGPVVAVLVTLIRISARAHAAAAEQAAGLANYVRENARTFVGVFVGFGLAAASSGAVAAWIPVVLERAFAQSPAQTGVRLGAVSAAATLLGVLASGLMARKLRPRLGRLTPLRISEVGVLAALLTVPVFLSADSAWQVYLAIGIHTIAITVCLSLSPTILQFMAPRLMRGRVIALGGLIYMVFMSLTPILVGGISDRVTAGPRGLLLAIIIVGGPCYLLSFFFMRFAEPTLARTFEAVEATE